MRWDGVAVPRDEGTVSDCKVIIVEGGIGSGKTELSQELAAAMTAASGLPTVLLLEPTTQDEVGGANPYLTDYYADQRRWAFVMQVHLLQERFRMHLEAQWYAMAGRGHAVVDRSVYGDVSFLELQRRDGHVDDREYRTYKRLYAAMTAFVRLPSVCLRLLVDPAVAARRIDERASRVAGRKCESVIEVGYLQRLDEEIDQVVRELQLGGVTIMDVHWDQDRPDTGARQEAVRALAFRILRIGDPALRHLHRRRM